MAELSQDQIRELDTLTAPRPYYEADGVEGIPNSALRKTLPGPPSPVPYEPIRPEQNYQSQLDPMLQHAVESEGLGLAGNDTANVAPPQRNRPEDILARDMFGPDVQLNWADRLRLRMNMADGGLMQLAGRRQQIAQQALQLEEQKRQHDLGMLEKAMASPRANIFLDQLAQDQNFKFAKQAAMLSKGLKESDFGSMEAYKEFIPDDVQERFLKGTLPSLELNAWLDQARESAKLNAKEQAKSAILQRAQNKPAEQRSPYEAQLVEEHAAASELKRADIDLKKAQTLKAQHDAQSSPTDKGFGIDREAFTQQLFGRGKRYADLTQSQMQTVNSEVAKHQGVVQYNKSTGSQKAQLEVPDKMPEVERQKAYTELSTLGLVDQINKSYSDAFIGPVRGRYGSITELIGGQGEDEAEFRADLATLRNGVVTAITGAQMGEAEATRILRQVPDPNNPPEVFSARLKSTRANLMRMAQKRREILGATGIDITHLPPLPDNTKIKSALDSVLGGKK